MITNQPITEILLSALRISMITLSVNTSFYYLMRKMLTEKRGPVPYGIYIVLRLFIVDLFCMIIYPSLFIPPTYWDTLLACIVTIVSVANLVIVCFTFHGSLGKIMIASFVSEIASVILSFFSITVVNLLERRPDSSEYAMPFEPLDFLYPLLFLALCKLVFHVFTPAMEKYQKHRLKHEKLFVFLFFFYMCFASTSKFQPQSAPVWAFIGPIFLLDICMILALGLLQRLRRSTQRKKEYLKASQQLMTSHHMAIQRQIQHLEETQHIVDKQMQEIINAEREHRSDDTSSVESDLMIRDYLKELKQNYTNTRAGMYCNDWLLDAALCSQADILKEHGLTLRCSLQGYDTRGTLDEWDIIQLVLLLLDIGIDVNPIADTATNVNSHEDTDAHQNEDTYQNEDENKNEMILQISSVKNQLVIHFEAIKQQDISASHLRKLKKMLRNLHGEKQLGQEADRIHITLLLPLFDEKE